MTESIPLPSELTIYGVLEARDALLGAAAAEPAAPDAALTVDGSSVAEVDAAGIQLLVALRRQLDTQGRALRVRSASAPLAAACATLGVAYLLEAA